METIINTSYYTSPIGIIEIQSINEKICSALFVDAVNENITSESTVNLECIKQLNLYFEGTLTQFNLPKQQNGTAFQYKVWEQLQTIPYGTTTSYLDIAKKIGDAKSVRAVGTSNGKNKLLIIYPCHRVIASNGNLTGYAGELWRKEWLLKHEIQFAETPKDRLF